MPGQPPYHSRTKAALRDHFRQYRAQLSDAAYATRSAAIVRRIRQLAEVRRARTIHLYRPLAAHREVDIRALFSWLHAEKKQLVLPVVANFSQAEAGPPQLIHRRYMGPGDLQRNRWGIEEPVAGETVPLEAIDLVVVPALGAGRNGHRIGHGFGYYDSFLRDLQVPTVCPVYAACLVQDVPAEPHDVSLSIIVTEDEVIRPSGRL